MHRLLVLVMCSGLLACETKSGDPPSPAPTVKGTATAVVTASASASSTGDVTSTDDALKPREPKAYGHPADDELGTLPEGVGIAVGQKAPDFELKQSDGTVVKLSELLKKSEVLLTFYRGGW